MKIPKKMKVNNITYKLYKIYPRYAVYDSEYGYKECFLLIEIFMLRKERKLHEMS